MNRNGNLICIVGQTATGKSSLAIKVAREFNGEIICADSWTVRRAVDIGTAKPSEEERKLVPHHLVDVIGPEDDFNAAMFKDLANTAIKDIVSRGKIPVLVGGTGLYVDSVIYDYSFASVGTRQARLQLDSLTIPELLNKIDDLGIDLGDVDVRNKRRLVRFIETKGAKPTRKEIRNNTLLLGLKTGKGELDNNIRVRTQHMMDSGLQNEVEHLYKRYGWECEALKGIGYSQWRAYFLGTDKLEDVTTKINKATTNLAKRQATWFKRNKSIHWLDTPVNWIQVVDLITTFLDKNIS